MDAELGKVLAENLQGALPAIALDGHPGLTTAYMNDCEPLLCYAQQVNGFGRKGDVLLGISTSGNSKNVLYAAVVAKARGMKRHRSYRSEGEQTPALCGRLYPCAADRDL